MVMGRKRKRWSVVMMEIGREKLRKRCSSDGDERNVDGNVLLLVY